MSLEFGAVSPWLDDWGIQRQLWSGAKIPGNELSLASPTSRSLTARWKDALGAIVLTITEFQVNPQIKILSAAQGVVEIAIAGTSWNSLKQSEVYTVEILAYGSVRDSFTFDSSLPEPGSKILNGISVYSSPRQILELVGHIPGADIQTGVNLSGGWTKNGQGYWIKSIPSTQAVFGLWIDDQHSTQVDYEDLALAGDRMFSRVYGIAGTDTLYYSGSENLADPWIYVETAHNRYVLRCLEEATQDVETTTGTAFNKRQVLRELHRGLYRQRQVATQYSPVAVDRTFRLDCYNRARAHVRRYTEDAVFTGRYTGTAVNDRLFVETATGIITLTEAWWDWASWGSDIDSMGLRGMASFSTGDVAIELTYVAGRKYPPKDITEAATQLAACRQLQFWERAMSQGLDQLNLGCTTMRFADSKKYTEGWKQSAESTLSAYSKIDVEVL